jgi:flagellar L-ring protein precursor FlgH
MRLRSFFVIALGAVAGCAQIQNVPDVDLAQVEPPPVQGAEPQLPAPTNGAIYQVATFRPLFENHRARHVGDTVTVQIVEKVSATQSSTSTVDKSGALDASIKALPGLSAGAFNRASASGSSSNTFAGKGTTQNSNDFSGTLTAVVTRVLPNGHLVVAAEKQIGVNANVDVLRFTGQIDPQTIAPGNVVQSSQIANVRVEQRGRGQQAEAQSMGWLARFFNIVWPI